MYIYIYTHTHIHPRGARPAARPKAAEVRDSPAARRLRSPARLPGPPLGADSGGGAAEEGRGRGRVSGAGRAGDPQTAALGRPEGSAATLRGKALRPAVAV